MKIYLAADHAGYDLKEQIKAHLRELGYEVEDEGAFALDPQDDYPDYITVAAKMVQGEPGSRGVVFGGSGQGEAMAANRLKGVRAVVYYGGNKEDIIRLSREHNDANVLSIGARFVSAEEAKEMVKVWLNTGFSRDERHIRRLQKVDGLIKSENNF